MKLSITLRNSLLMCLIMAHVCAFAQSAQKKYKPVEDNKLMMSRAKTDVEKRKLKRLEVAPKAYEKQYEKIVNEYYDERLSDIEDYNFIFDERFDQFIDHILTEIKRANPQLALSKIDFLVSRSHVPNASMNFDGLMVINLGLIDYCTSESEIAFVICHEIAHHLEKHGEKRLNSYLDKTYSKEAQRELKKLAKTEYNRYEKAIKYAKEFYYDRSRHSRYHETEADSLALVLMEHTKYNSFGACSFFETMDKVDTAMMTPTFDIAKILHFSDYPFKKSWIKPEEVMFGGAKLQNLTFDKDSLKTHPDCLARAAMAKDVFLKKYVANGKLKNILPDTTYNNLRKIAQYEIIIHQFNIDNMDYALFRTLNMLQQYPDDVFLKLVVGQSLLELHDARKQHTFSKYVSLPSEYMKELYQPFLRVLNNTTKVDLASLAYFYLKQHQASIPTDDEAFMFFSAKSAYNLQKKEEYLEIKRKFLELYPEGERAKELRELKPLGTE